MIKLTCGIHNIDMAEKFNYYTIDKNNGKMVFKLDGHRRIYMQKHLMGYTFAKIEVYKNDNLDSKYILNFMYNDSIKGYELTIKELKINNDIEEVQPKMLKFLTNEIKKVLNSKENKIKFMEV